MYYIGVDVHKKTISYCNCAMIFRPSSEVRLSSNAWAHSRIWRTNWAVTHGPGLKFLPKLFGIVRRHATAAIESPTSDLNCATVNKEFNSGNETCILGG
jgi:hypothetical protein